MKQFLLTCFLLLRLAQQKDSHNGDGEYTRWYSKNTTFTLPVSCKFSEKVKIGDDLLHSPWLGLKIKYEHQYWTLVVVKKFDVWDIDDLE